MANRSIILDVFVLLFKGLRSLFRTITPWASIPVAALGFLLAVILWNLIFPHPLFRQFGFYFGGIVAVLSLAAGVDGMLFRRKQLAFLDAHIDMDWVRGLDWREFESQMAAVYRQQGYQVEELGGSGPDGGIDLRLFYDGYVTVVQCKHWKTWKVGVRPIRELYGVMTAEGAHRAIFITSGTYTSEARRFAAGKPLDLIDRDGFLELVRLFQMDLQAQYGVAPESEPTPAPESTPQESLPKCPLCQEPMVLRTAKKGFKAGSQFWGCSRYPDCRGTLDYSNAG